MLEGSLLALAVELAAARLCMRGCSNGRSAKLGERGGRGSWLLLAKPAGRRGRYWGGLLLGWLAGGIAEGERVHDKRARRPLPPCVYMKS